MQFKSLRVQRIWNVHVTLNRTNTHAVVYMFSVDGPFADMK